MAKHSNEIVNSTFLRQTVRDMIGNLEIMVTNIHGVVGEINQIMRQIDTVTARIESKHKTKVHVKKPNVLLDKNSNQCELLETPMTSSQSKMTLTSPYMDFTYLDLSKDCEVCDGALTSFTYNEKYPLWIQYDTWQTGTTTSEISVVSGGSSTGNLSGGSESDITTFKTWNSLTQCNTDDVQRGCRRSKVKVTVTEHKDNTSDIDVTYCGLYEEMMEKQLESIELVYEEVGSDVDDDTFCDDISDCVSVTSMSLSDDHVVRYNKNLSSWTSFRMAHMGHSVDSDDSSEECIDV